MSGTSQPTLQGNESDLLNVKAGEVTLFPGGPDNLYRLQEGLIRIHTVDDEGNGLTLRYVKPGGFFGEESLVGLPRRYFAEAVTASAVEVMSPATLSPQQNLVLTTHLVEAMEHESLLPAMRVGMAYGNVVSRLGDVFGTTVNRASRLTAVTPQGRVYVDEPLATMLGEVSGFEVIPSRRRILRGIGAVRPRELRRYPGERRASG